MVSLDFLRISSDFTNPLSITLISSSGLRFHKIFYDYYDSIMISVGFPKTLLQIIQASQQCYCPDNDFIRCYMISYDLNMISLGFPMTLLQIPEASH